MKTQTPLFGFHASIAGGFPLAVEQTASFGCTAQQIFVHNPRGWKERPFAEGEAEKFREQSEKLNVPFTVGHASYLTNLAKTPGEEQAYLSREFLKHDLASLKKMGAAGLVVHCGKQLEMSEEEALKNIATNILQVLKESSGPKLLLENAAGQGSEIGTSIKQFVQLGELTEWPDRLGFCFDTCHAFAAGEADFRTPEGTEAICNRLEKELGERLVCVHFNDSKKGFESRVDRHANLGHGEIPLESLRIFAHWAVKQEIPLLLETPEEFFAEDIVLLKSWVMGK